MLVVEPADLARALLDDGAAEGHLAVAGEHRPILVPHGKDRCRVHVRPVCLKK